MLLPWLPYLEGLGIGFGMRIGFFRRAALAWNVADGLQRFGWVQNPSCYWFYTRSLESFLSGTVRNVQFSSDFLNGQARYGHVSLSAEKGDFPLDIICLL